MYSLLVFRFSSNTDAEPQPRHVGYMPTCRAVDFRLGLPADIGMPIRSVSFPRE